MRFGICKKDARGCKEGHTYAIADGGVLRDAYEAACLDGRLWVKFVCVGRFGEAELGEFFGELRVVA